MMNAVNSQNFSALSPGVDDLAEADTFSAAHRAELMDRIYGRGDRLVTKFILLHALIAFSLAFFYRTWLVTGIVTSCALAVFGVSVWLLPRSFITRCLAGISLQTFVALHIYQMHGLAEMHFLFFTAFTVLIVYQDWKCLWPGALGLIGQHLGFALLHNAGLGGGLFFFEEGYVGVTKLVFHFTIALGQVAICGYWAYLLHRQTLASAVQNAGLRALGQQMHRSEGKFRALIEHALDVITVSSPEGIILYESPSIERLLGHRPQDLVGRHGIELVHPDDRPAMLAALARRIEAGVPGSVPVECRYQHRDGSWRIFEAVGSKIDVNAGGLVINSRDVTERRAAEREAKRRAGQQNTTSELARQALTGSDLSALLASTVTLVASTLEVEFCYVGERSEDDEHLLVRAEVGYSARGSVEKTIPTGISSQGGFTLLANEPVIVEDMPTETRFSPTSLAREQGIRSGLSVIIGGREQVFGVLVTQSTDPRRFTGDDIAFLSAVADILSAALERDRADRALRAAKEEAEQANRAKSEFLSRMSHELRTPLNAIIGFGQLLELGQLPRRESESVNHIMKGGRHLLGLIDEVLAISRIEAGRMDLSLEPIGVAEIVQDCLAFVDRQAAMRRVNFQNDCVPSMGDLPHVQADRQRLRQVLLNLFSNAIKYNREGGLVTVSCHEPPASDPDARHWRLEVTDTGRGLSREEINRLFTPFERLGAERTATEGTGLGLAVSKALVEAMGGTIGVASMPGQGSTFWVELPWAADPLARLKNAVAPVDLTSLDPPRAGTVLYIEDNLSNLRLVEMLLEPRPDLRLLSAAHGRLGLEIARARRPDLILLDLHLPDLPGWDVLSELQHDPRTRDIPTVIISADATPGQIARLLEAGACEYLTKPIDVASLLQTLDNHLQSPRAELVIL